MKREDGGVMGINAKTSHVIVEIDRDYRTVSGVEYKYFSSDDEAKLYASQNSWTGYTYIAYRWEDYFK